MVVFTAVVFLNFFFICFPLDKFSNYPLSGGALYLALLCYSAITTLIFALWLYPKAFSIKEFLKDFDTSNGMDVDSFFILATFTFCICIGIPLCWVEYQSGFTIQEKALLAYWHGILTLYCLRYFLECICIAVMVIMSSLGLAVIWLVVKYVFLDLIFL